MMEGQLHSKHTGCPEDTGADVGSSAVGVAAAVVPVVTSIPVGFADYQEHAGPAGLDGGGLWPP